MGAATKGRSTGKSGTTKTSAKTGTSRGAARTAKAEEAETAEPRESREPARDEAPQETNGVPTTSGGAIVATATSSQQAAEQRQQVDAPAVIAGEATAKQADEAKAMALPEVPVTPATAPGLEQLAVEQSRQRAHVVGEQARLQQYASDVGAGTREPGKAEVRTYARLQAPAPQPQENIVEHKEVAIAVGDRELVFRQNFGGFVEVLWNDPARINAMRGGGPFNAIATLTPEQWAALSELDGDGDTGSAPEGQSAAEQRAGVAKAGQGGDPGPAAPLPVFPR